MPLTFNPATLFFGRRCSLVEPRFSLDSLPNDVLVDCIFVHLHVKDILRMRQVNKLCYYLTHHAAIWKRLLRETELPLPPLPPTSRHNLENLTGLEAERLLTRAHSLDKVLTSHTVDLYDHWEFDSHYKVHEMVLLPGSQYLIASISDDTFQDWYLMLYVLDNRYSVVPIAKTPTKTKAFHLRAKYLTINGEHGITISYIHRQWRRRAHAYRGINVSEYSGDHEIDAPYPLKYQCITLHCPLPALEALCNPALVPGSDAFNTFARTLPDPFLLVSRIRSSRRLMSPSLDDFAGRPVVSVVKCPNDILFKPLDGGPALTLCILPFNEFDDCPHRIKAFRPLPQQGQVLVAREIKVPPERNPYCVLGVELQNVQLGPKHPSEVKRIPDDFVFLYDDDFSDIFITDHGTPNWFDDSICPTLQRDADRFKPRPINVFCKTTLPAHGLLRLTFYPKLPDAVTGAPSTTSTTPVGSPALSFTGSSKSIHSDSTPYEFTPRYNYRYALDYCSPVRFVEAHMRAQYKILPGSYRTLLYTIPYDDFSLTPPIIGFFRYHDRELFSNVPEELEGEGGMLEEEVMRKPVRRMAFNFSGERFAWIAWDETVGRICFAKPEDKVIKVLDCSRRPKEDVLGRRIPMPVQQDHDVYMEPAERQGDPPNWDACAF